MFKNLFKRINKHGNYPLPSKELTDEERSRRADYNYDIIFKDVYIPNRELEELIGMSMKDDNVRIKNSLTRDQLERVNDLISHELDVFLIFNETMCDDSEKLFNNFFDEESTPLLASIKGIKYKKKEEEKDIYYIPYMREIYRQSMEKYYASPDTNEYKDFKYPETYEEMKEYVEKRLDIKPFLQLTFRIMAPPLVFLHKNFHGASKPLYDLY